MAFGIATAGETESSLKETTADSCHLRHWYSLPRMCRPGADSITGATGVGKRTQCTLLSEKLGFKHISLKDVIRERSNDHTYPHAHFLKDCLDESVNVPTGLSISLLEESIKKCVEDGKRWILVRGFPESTEELQEFEDKVGVMP